ncbi:MAG: hypothetical protein IPI73_14615 [Betaproteobacteria bacterium]|nr:hypothetical protein [Betaproteobacteria bacterium]
MRRRVKYFNVRVALMFIAGIGGILALVIAALTQYDVARDRDRHAFLSGLPDLGSEPHAGTGIVDGRIAASVPQLRGEFVAYVREQYRSTTARTSGWTWLDGLVQPLTIETAGGAVRIVNADYAFERGINAWTASSREESPATATSGSIRIAGLVAGGPVMAVGRPAPGGTPGQVIAEAIAGVDRRTYLDRLAQGHVRAQSLVIWLVLVGVAGTACAAWAARRIGRTC